MLVPLKSEHETSHRFEAGHIFAMYESALGPENVRWIK